MSALFVRYNLTVTMKKRTPKAIKEPAEFSHKHLNRIALFVCAFGLLFSIYYCQNHPPITTYIEDPVSESTKFRLDDEYYRAGELRDIAAADFNQLVADKKSFIVMAHMLICPAEAPLHTTTQTLTSTDNLVIYGMTEEEFKQTSLSETIKYLPTAAIYRDGELVAWLDAESDADLPAYKSADGLRDWLSRYIELQ